MQLCSYYIYIIALAIKKLAHYNNVQKKQGSIALLAGEVRVKKSLGPRLRCGRMARHFNAVSILYVRILPTTFLLFFSLFCLLF